VVTGDGLDTCDLLGDHITAAYAGSAFGAAGKCPL
jgi:hypothetical protein